MGSETGARDRVDRIVHSDTWYSAITSAMRQLGWLPEWLAATAETQTPAVRLSSLFFGLDEALLVPAPAPLWPPANLSSKLRGDCAAWIPASVTAQLAVGGGINEDQWEVDGSSACLLRRGRKSSRTGPFRFALRSHAGVDRLEPGRIDVHRTACIEWADTAWLWFAADFSDDAAQETWSPKLEGAVRLLGDSGVGGKRSAGWGHFDVESFTRGKLSELILGSPRRQDTSESPAPTESGYWLLSLFCPSPADAIDWSRGSFSLVERGGRVESAAGWGAEKKTVRMVKEGSVLLSETALTGSAPDVAPDGFAHPVYRNGHAVAIPLPWRVNG